MRIFVLLPASALRFLSEKVKRKIARYSPPCPETRIVEGQSVFKHGKDVCDARLISKDRLEAFVIDRVKANILTEENLAVLVRLANEEIGQAKNEYEDRLAVIDSHLVRERLHKLYSALEPQLQLYFEACAQSGHKPYLVYLHPIYLGTRAAEIRSKCEKYLRRFLAYNAKPVELLGYSAEELGRAMVFMPAGPLRPWPVSLIWWSGRLLGWDPGRGARAHSPNAGTGGR